MREGMKFSALRGIFITCLILLSAGAAFGQATAGYSEYLLPGDEQNMYFIFNDLDTNAGATGMHSIISVVAWSANTTVYFDHWENGYNFDPNNPSTADETYTLATPGTIKLFESSNVPNIRNVASTCAGQTNPGNRCYDGGDRIYVAGGPVTVTRAVWMEARGAGNQGDAWEIYPVKPQLTTYVLPFGEDNFVTSNLFFTGFERVYALIQATQDNTTVTVDLNNDGVPDILNLNRDATWNNAGDGTTVTLQKGQTFLLDRVSACSLHTTCTTFPGGGPLNSGAVINGNNTLQVKYVAGRIAQTYAARGLSAFPRGFWTNDYYAPFGQAANANNGVTDYYLFNPSSTPLTVNWQSQAASGSFAIPANSAQSYNRAIGANPSVPAGSGLYFSATSPFWGVGFGDSTSQGTPTGQAFEWGFSLLPTTFLYKEHFLGWSPGSLPLTTAPTNGNGIFLTVGQDNTQVFVDYNNDGVPDQTYTLSRLQSQFIPPGPSGALDGARFWATGLFSMAYGENADTAATPTPNLDLGYVALPGTDFVSLVLTTTKTANPKVVSTATGSTTDFTILVNSQAYSIDSVSVVDTMPPNWQFVPGFTTITKPDLTVTNSAAGAGTVTTNGTAAVVGTGTTFTALTAGTPITIAGIGNGRKPVRSDVVRCKDRREHGRQPADHHHVQSRHHVRFHRGNAEPEQCRGQRNANRRLQPGRCANIQRQRLHLRGVGQRPDHESLERSGSDAALPRRHLHLHGRRDHLAQPVDGRRQLQQPGLQPQRRNAELVRELDRSGRHGRRRDERRRGGRRHSDRRHRAAAGQQQLDRDDDLACRQPDRRDHRTPLVPLPHRHRRRSRRCVHDPGGDKRSRRSVPHYRRHDHRHYRRIDRHGQLRYLRLDRGKHGDPLHLPESQLRRGDGVHLYR
jgi:hypothetical protein